VPTNSTDTSLPNLLVIPKGQAPLNATAMDLANLAAWHQQTIGNTGLLAAPPEGVSSQLLGTIPNPAATQRRVWLDEPPGSVPFDEQATAQIPIFPGADQAVLTFTVPQGYDGVIKWVSNNAVNIVPTPFVAGELIWKIEVNGRPVRNFGNITQEKGTIFQGRQVSPIRIFSGDTVTYTVQLAPGSPITSGQTTVSATGYYYPSKGIS
jgi:hypothetical protein